MTWEKAGQIASEVREYARGLIKIDASLLEVTEKIEEKIFSKAKCAFPVQISLNKVAAHNCARIEDETILKKEDVVKVDIGVSVDGYIGDTAFTVDLSGENEDLIKASEEALKQAIKTVKVGIKISEIGKAIQEAIQKYGYSPVRNLTGHGLNLYKIHDSPSIPNYDNGSLTVLKKGQVIAIEPFATNGVGIITETKESGVYYLINKRNVRDLTCRKIMKFIDEEYNGLPFSERWIAKQFSGASFYLKLLEKEGVLHHYLQLAEKSKGLVSQAEHSLLVSDEVKVLTK